MDQNTTHSLEEYFRVNVHKKLAIKIPEQEDHKLTPATRLLEKRREMLEVENGLTAQKEDFANKMETLAQRRQDLGKKENQLKESLLKFEKFLKENEAKRTRALKKSQDERKIKEAKEQEIGKLKETANTLILKKKKQVDSLQNMLVYQKYLESVLETVDDFGEVKDIIARHDTLVATNEELMVRARETQERNERERALFHSKTEEKNNIILNYNNELANLQTRLEESQHKSAFWQAEWDHTIKNATQKSLLLGQIKMATANLFNVVKSHLNNRLNWTSDTSLQLEKIQQFILDLSQITEEQKVPVKN